MSAGGSYGLSTSLVATSKRTSTTSPARRLCTSTSSPCSVTRVLSSGESHPTAWRSAPDYIPCSAAGRPDAPQTPCPSLRLLSDKPLRYIHHLTTGRPVPERRVTPTFSTLPQPALAWIRLWQPYRALEPHEVRDMSARARKLEKQEGAPTLMPGRPI